jgi:hypothetical protein
MPQWFRSLVEGLRKPEWVAALVLLIQAVILYLQYEILGRHAETMEAHTEIAGAQSKTAELIGKALDQQGKILAEQTKIMEEQLKFSRIVEIKREKVQVFDHLLELGISFGLLHASLLEVQLSNYTAEKESEIKSKWKQLKQDFVRCTQTIHTSAHLDPEDRDYFLGYVTDLSLLGESSDIKRDIESVRAFHEKYKDFTKRMFAAGRSAPASRLEKF